MKRILLITLLWTGYAKSQIEVVKREVEKIKPTLVETFSVGEYKKSAQFLGLIGQELFIFPIKDGCNLPERDLEKYYTIAEEDIKEKRKVKYAKGAEVPYDVTKILGSNVVVKDVIFYEGFFSSRKKVLPHRWVSNWGNVDVKVYSSKTNEEFYIKLDQFSDSDLITMPYYNYLKNKYENIEFISDKDMRFSDFKMESVRENDIYKAKVVLQESERGCGLNLILQMSNSLNDKKNYLLNNRYSLDNTKIKYDWKKLSDYENKLNEKLAKDADKERQKKEREAIIYSKYKKSTAEYILMGLVWVGMTEEQLMDSKGTPYKRNYTTTKYSETQQLIYKERWAGEDRYIYVYLENGKVTAVQD